MGLRAYGMISNTKEIGGREISVVKSCNSFFIQQEGLKGTLLLPSALDEQLELVAYLEDEIYNHQTNNNINKTATGASIESSIMYLTTDRKFKYFCGYSAQNDVYRLILTTHFGSTSKEENSVRIITFSAGEIENFLEFLKESFSELSRFRDEDLL